MRMSLCYQLMKRYNNIVVVFTDADNNDVAIIEKTSKPLWFESRRYSLPQYLITYNYLTTPCVCGDYRFGTLEEAVERVKKHRPNAYRVG